MKYLIKLLVKIAPWSFLIASLAEIGWGVVIEEGDNDEELVQGLVVGTEEYIKKHTEKEV